ncbi:unnamed protein product [Cochlearia groenlandica]
MSESSSSLTSHTLSLIIFFFILLVLLCPSLSSSSESQAHVLDRELLEIRTNPNPDKAVRKPKCCEMRTRSQCLGYNRCKWCRSEALDDLCFSKGEALRLPSQVFLCHFAHIIPWKSSSNMYATLKTDAYNKRQKLAQE